jgi:hypothetical protein
MVDLYQKINDILGQRTFNCQKMSFHYDIIIPCDTPEHTFENEVMQEGGGVPLEATVEALSLPFTSRPTRQYISSPPPPNRQTKARQRSGARQSCGAEHRATWGWQ